MLMIQKVQPRIAQGGLPIPEDLMSSLPTIWGSYSPAMCAGRVLVYTEAISLLSAGLCEHFV